MIIGKRKNKFFTLAEVLITLAVVGALAALVIPALYQNTEKQQLRTACKNFFADLSQAVQQIKMDNGGDLLNRYNGAITTFVGDLAKYMNYTKKCTNFDTAGNCWHTQWYNQSNAIATIGLFQGIILSNGDLVAEEGEATACNRYGMYCVVFLVDINGFKGPNTYGSDIFLFGLTKDGAVPTGTPGDATFANDCGTGRSGGSCAQLVLQNIDY